MARMIPSFGPAETESRAEPTIYHLLKKQLSDDFVVIHSLPWLAAAAAEIGNAGSAPTGEIDFVILHPELGMLAIEIKGGRYRIDGAAFVPVAGGTPLFVLNQVRRNSHGVARWLGGKCDIRWPIGYAMGFPSNVFPDEALPPGMFDAARQQRITFDMRDLPNLGAKVAELMSYWKSALRLGALGDARMGKIIEMLCPQYDGTPQWAQRIQYDGHFWLPLTEDQSAIASRVLRAHGGIVTGWPGTGKTLIGIEIARRLSAAGERVLFLTFNALLCDHLRVQLNDSNCQVHTWHKLCNSARDLLGRPVAEPGWFDKECLDDLAAAIGHDQFAFDVLVVDEAQALRPQWWQLLCRWFAGKSIFAFCDETQVFSFEKETTSPASLLAMSGLAQMQLSIVLRMPKAVTEKLSEVMPNQLQVSSPRPLDPDTLHEIVVADCSEALKEIVSRLMSQGATHPDIVVLSKTGYVRDPIDEFLHANKEIRRSPVSRFRGMEAPLVIIVEADELSDTELFSAYSRATTACFAIYTADSIHENSQSKFQAAVFGSPANQNVIREVKLRRTSAYRLGGHDMKKLDGIKSIDLTWSRTLKTFLVQLPRETPAALWIDYLNEIKNWPTLIITHEEPNQIAIALPGHNAEHGIRLKDCTKCEMITPHYYFPSNSCLVCNDVLGGDARTLRTGEVKSLMELDRAVVSIPMSTSVNEAMEIYHQLPFLLGAAAVGGHVWQTMNVKMPPSLPGTVSTYRAAVALAYSYAHLCGSSKSFSLPELIEQTWHRDFDVLSIDRAAWHRHLANALSRLYQQEVITKVKEGISSGRGKNTIWRLYTYSEQTSD